MRACERVRSGALEGGFVTVNRRLIGEILAFAVVVLLIVVFMARRAGGPGRYSDHRVMMGTVVGVTVFAGDQDTADAAMEAAFAEVARVESLASRYVESSVVSRWNARTAEEASLDPEVASVVGRAIVVARLSQGAFDPTVAPVIDLWDFEPGARVPDDDEIMRALARVDYAQLDLDAAGGTLRAPLDVEIDLDGIIKGYAVDRVVAVLRSEGVEAAIVDAGGDIGFLGSSPTGPAWRVGVKHPRREGLLGVLAVEGGSVATSGDYQRTVDIDGVSYHHLIDTATGYPARDLASATVWARSALDADALATAVFVMGPEDGLALAERLDDVEALVVTAEGDVRGTPRAEERFTQTEEGETDGR